MKWTAQLEPKRYILAYVRSLPVWYYLYFLFVAILIGMLNTKTMPSFITVAITVFLSLIAIFTSSLWRRLRRTERLTGESAFRYTLTADSLVVAIGKDSITLPLQDLKFHRQGKGFISLRRKKTRLGLLMLFFDDADTQQRVHTKLDQD